MGWRNLAECGERTLLDGTTRVCVRVADHDGLHQDLTGQPWETDLEALTRLRTRWGHRWHIIFTGHMWIATTYRSKRMERPDHVEHPERVDHLERVETAPCPEQLNEQLQRVHPHVRNDRRNGVSTWECNYDPLDPENAPLTEDEQASLEAQDHLMELRSRARRSGGRPGD